MTNKESLIHLENHQVAERIVACRALERLRIVEILKLLKEIERRSIHLDLGYSSLFSFCRKELCYSEGATSRRIRASRVLARFPAVGELLQSGEVNLSTLSLVASVLNESNSGELLTAIRGKSQREVEEVLAEYRPRAEPKEKIAPLHLRAPRVRNATRDTHCGGRENGQADFLSNAQRHRSEGLPVGATAGESAKEPRRVNPHESELRYELRFSVGKGTREKLARAQVLLSGKYPRGASLEETLGELLTVYLAGKCPIERNRRSAKRKKKAKKTGERTSSEVVHPEPKKRTREHVPTSVRKEVLRRDNYCCSFLSPDGTCCGSTWQLELDHILPIALGGENSAANMRVLCRNHNVRMAEKHFGTAHMRQFRTTERNSCS